MTEIDYREICANDFTPTTMVEAFIREHCPHRLREPHVSQWMGALVLALEEAYQKGVRDSGALEPKK